jgi:Xaa-Pro aminopeptidase
MTAIQTSVFDEARRSRGGLWNKERLLQKMQDAGVDGVVATSPRNVIYTSGAYIAIDVLPTFIVTTASGERAAVINEADDKFLRAYSPVTNVRSFGFSADGIASAIGLLAEFLAELGLAESTLGIEFSAVSAERLQQLHEGCPGVTWADAEPIFQATRLIKTPDELAVLRAAAAATADVIDAAFPEATQTSTEKELAAQIQARALLAGADELSHANINAGVHSTLGHSISLEKTIERQEVIHVDFGAKWAGYTSDVSRNAVMVEPTRKQRDIYARLFEIHRALLDWIRPGVTSGEVFDRGIAEFEKVGLTHPWTTLGHSIGLAMHEGFELSPGVDIALEPGMVVCVEPSHIEPDDARYDVEDMIAITKDGIEILSRGSDPATMREIR